MPFHVFSRKLGKRGSLHQRLLAVTDGVPAVRRCCTGEFHRFTRLTVRFCPDGLRRMNPGDCFHQFQPVVSGRAQPLAGILLLWAQQVRQAPVPAYSLKPTASQGFFLYTIVNFHQDLPACELPAFFRDQHEREG